MTVEKEAIYAALEQIYKGSVREASYYELGGRATEKEGYHFWFRGEEESSQVHVWTFLEGNTIRIERYTTTPLSSFSDFNVESNLNRDALTIINGKLIEKVEKIYKENFQDFLGRPKVFK